MKILISCLTFFLILNITFAQQKRIYLAPDDHTDYMWATDEAGYKQAFLDMLDYYIALNESTANDSAPYQNKWNCDGSFWVYTYRNNRTTAQFQKLINQIKLGQITVPLNTLVALPGIEPVETLIRGMYYAGSLEKEFGLNLELAFSMEDQVMPLGLASIWAGCGAKYSWHGVCGCATKVTGFNSRPHEIYWYKGLDGQKVLMKWYSKVTNSQNLGGYAEANDPIASISSCKTLMNNTVKYPYSISGAFGRGWDAIETLTNEFPGDAKNNTNANYQVIVSNEIDFFKDFESHYGNSLPSETVSYGTEWGNLVASLAEISASMKRSTEKLRGAEALYTIVSLKDNTFGTNLSAQRQLAWIASALYYDHDWTADGSISRHDRATWERKMATEFGSYVDTLYNRSLVRLGQLVIKPNTSDEVFFVLNSLGWSRTDYCDYPYSGSQNVHVIDKSNSGEIPYQFITKKGINYLRILASNVPSAGYKLFEIVPGPSSVVLNSAATITNNVIENSIYKITLTKQGVIKSLIDKSNSNQEFVKSVNNLYINDLGSGLGENGNNLQTENIGAVSVTLVSSSNFPLQHTSKITLFRNSRRIEIENTITQNYSNVLTYAFSLNITNPDIWHEEAGAVLHAKSVSNGGNYSDVIQRLDWLTLNHFADITGNSYGVTLSNRDCYLMKPGNSTVTTLDNATPQINVLAGGQIDADKGLGIPNQDGDSYFEDYFGLTTHTSSFNATSAMKFSLEHQNALISGKVLGSTGYTGNTFSLINVSNTNDLLWAFKPAEEGINNGIVFRLWNMDNSDNNCTISSDYTINQYRSITHLETDIGSLTQVSGSFSTTVGHNRMQSFRIFINDTSSSTKSSQTITFNTLAVNVYGNSDFDPGAIASSGLPVSYTSDNINVADIQFGLVHIVGAGSCNITASQAGNSNYLAAPPVSQLLTVNMAPQSITFNVLPSISYYNPDFDPGAFASSGLPVSYSSDDTTVAKILNGLVHITGIGTCNITAIQTGNNNYETASSVTRGLTINNNAYQSIIFNAFPAETYGNPDFDPGATASSGLAISYSSDNINVASIKSNNIHITGAGNSNITAWQNGNTDYSAAVPVTLPLLVNKAILVVKAIDTSRVEEQDNPKFRLAYSGFVAGDDTSVLEVKPIASCAAIFTSTPGYYTIVVSGGWDNNYNFDYVNGILTVTPSTGIRYSILDNAKVYPNPASNYISIKSKNVGNIRIQLFDMLGHKLLDIYTPDRNINISTINPGIYNLRVDRTRIRLVKI